MIGENMDHLIEENMGLVNAIVNRFSPKTYDERDQLTQAGRIGLWKALKKFDPDRGCKLSPYAWNPIKWEILKEIRFLKKTESMERLSNEDLEDMESSELWEVMPDVLSNSEKKVIILRTEGYKLQEICEFMQMGRSKIKRLVYQAVRKVRESNE